MLLNYHELTMSESKDSPQRQLQFKIICLIIATCFVFSVWLSGVLLTIEPFETPFPGGQFCYKNFARDYVTSMGIGRRLMAEVLEAFPKEEDEAAGISAQERKKMIEDKVYHIYLDNPEDVGGAHTRWMSGVVATDDVEKYCDPLFNKNPKIKREKELHKNEPESEKKASELFEQALYQSIDLPVVDSIAIKFPFSNGFLSGLVFSYKIIPEMRQLAAERGEPGNMSVVVSRCSVEGAECTHYIPLSKGIGFHAGQPSTEDYQRGLPDEGFSLVETLKGGLRVVCPFLKPYLDDTTDEPAAGDNSEL